MQDQLIFPRLTSVSGRRPTTKDYVESYLAMMRAPVRSKTVFTTAGRQQVRSAGERVLLAPSGEPIRVIENPEGGNQIEHGDHLHAVIRPTPVTAKFTSI